jgi:two-component system, NtrC family, sensor kinase
MQILVAADDPISADLLKRAIAAAAGHDVVAVDTVPQALECIRQRPIRMVVGAWKAHRARSTFCEKVRTTWADGSIYLLMMIASPQKSCMRGADDSFDPSTFEQRLRIGLRVIDLEDRCRSLQAALVQRAAENECSTNRLHDTLKRLEQSRAQMVQSEKMASIGRLATGVAHEINNPTGYIGNNLKTLSGYQRDITALIDKYQVLRAGLEQPHILSGLDEPVRACIAEIHSFEQEIDITFLRDDIVDLINDCRTGTERIKKIVLDLKAFAHPDGDRLQLLDINKELGVTLNVVNNTLKYKAEVELDLGVLPAVRGYPQRLSQLFMNVLVNAAQAIEQQGLIKIRTRLTRGAVEVAISDNGRGIAPEYLPRIFDPFFTTKDVGQGTGLGMNIACNIVRQHKGTIDVTSRPGQGSTFTIRLPVTCESETTEPTAD